MQNIVFDDPYEFIPPAEAIFVPWLMKKIFPRVMRNRYGVREHTIVGLKHLQESLRRNDGVILSPNHCRAADPLLTGAIVRATPCNVYAMASWHVFRQSWLETFVCRRVGAFSIHREGLDRKALNFAIDAVANAKKPLVVFSEGVISSANDRLMPLMDGISFIARSAAKKRIKANPDSRVVVHPVAFRYQYEGDPHKLLPPTLTRLEKNFFWQPQSHLGTLDRINHLRHAVQCSREVQWYGEAKQGDVEVRIQQLANDVIQRHEQEWLGRKRTGDIIGRVKELRSTILPDMVAKKVDSKESARRWKHLADLYYAQCTSLHVVGYLNPDVPEDRLNHRMFETVERLEEELTDQTTVYPDNTVEIRIGEPIEVATKRDRSGDGDPLMKRLRTDMLELLGTKDQWPPQPVEDVPSED